MIDFQNASYAKLSSIPIEQIAGQIQPLLVDGEQPFVAYKGMRDFIVFTALRSGSWKTDTVESFHI